MDTTDSSRPVISSQNHGPEVSIVTLLLTVLQALALISRLATKFAVAHRFNLDDPLLGIALVFTVGNAIATTFQASNGLGQPVENLQDFQITKAQKARYACELCYIIGLCFMKLSVVAFLHKLTPNRKHRLLCAGFGIFIVLFTIVAIIALALQCDRPQVWLSTENKCFNRYAFWLFVYVFEMILNIFLIALPAIIMWGLHVRRMQKIGIWCCFGSRVFVIGALIAQAILFSHAYHSPDFQFYAWQASIASQVVICLSYITPCLPYLKPFLESLDSGMLNNDGIRRLGKSELDPKGYASTYCMQVIPSQVNTTKKSSHGHSPLSKLPSTSFAVAQELEDNNAMGSADSRESLAKITKTTSIIRTEENERALSPSRKTIPKIVVE